MTGLDLADLVVIGQALGVGPDAALARMDIPAARAALAEAPPPPAFLTRRRGRGRDQADARAAAASPVPWARRIRGRRGRTAVPGRQRLAGRPGPPGAAAVVIESLAAGLTPAGAAAWLRPRLSPLPAPRTIRGSVQSLGRGLRSALPGRGRGSAGMFYRGRMLARFTDRAAASISAAQQEARRLGYGHFDPEHLLLGLIRDGEGVAVTALDRLGISVDVLRQQVEDGIGRAGQPGRTYPAQPAAA